VQKPSPCNDYESLKSLNCRSTHYSKPAADHQDFSIERFSKLYLISDELANYFTIEAAQLKSSAAHINAIARLNVAHFLEEGIGIERDHILAAKYYEMANECILFACAFYGWLLQNGIGVPLKKHRMPLTWIWH
jgi:TPR repeat protein